VGLIWISCYFKGRVLKRTMWVIFIEIISLNKFLLKVCFEKFIVVLYYLHMKYQGDHRVIIIS
jgi:hypothetical protein